MAALRRKEQKETERSVRKTTNSAQPRARDVIFASSAWVHHSVTRLGEHPIYDDSPIR
jgi:hypothetical protein